MKNLIAVNIRKWREQKHLSQIHLAELCGWSGPRQNHYETGYRRPGIMELKIIAQKLRVPLERLVDTDSDPFENHLHKV